MFNFNKIGLAALVVVATMGTSFALTEQQYQIDLADQPMALSLPIGRVSYLELTNSSGEDRTFVLDALDTQVVVPAGETRRVRLNKDDLVTKRFYSYRVLEQEWAAAAAREELLSQAAQAATVVTTGSPTISKYEAPVFEEKAELPSQKSGDVVRGYW